MVILCIDPMPSNETTPRRRSRPDYRQASHGPTKTITVAHQLHLSRFTNMAKA